MNPLIKNFVASGAIGHRALLKFTATDGVLAVATAPADVIAGVADCPGGAKDGERFDAVLFGPAEVVCGGAISPGAFITAGAGGKAMAAAPAAGANAVLAGRLLVGGANGDFARAFINPGMMQGA
ncbi:hypothetical protein [Ensifer canadensis]